MSRQFRSDDTSKWLLGFGNGEDGDLTISSNTTEAPIDSSCSGSSGSKSLAATNASFAAGKIVLIFQTRGTGAGKWELNQIDSYVAGTITLKNELQNTYIDSGSSQAQVIQLKQYNNVTVNTGVTWSAKAWDGNIGGVLAFLAKGVVSVVGTISAAGKGFVGGSIYAWADYARQGQGEGDPGAGVNASSANGSGGGGGTSFAGRVSGGGGGANGANGGNGEDVNGGGGSFAGSGGVAHGSADLTTLSIGGGGGTSGRNGQGAVVGSPGGGAIIIIGSTVNVSGSVTARGTNGVNNTSNSDNAGSGGGAGGSILIKAKTATLGTALVASAGGSGGASGANGGDGGAGGVGRIHLDYLSSYTGTTSPTLDYRQDLLLTYPGGGSIMRKFL
jgi:hypothetical protein